jgi:hypothetical protein
MIFVSYSHADAKWCQDFLTMAAPLTKYGGMQVFSDTDITAGTLWRSTIQKSLEMSTVVVLLVSRHFLKSPFITDVELPYILKARNSRGLTVLWVLISHCLYEETPLLPIQAALPTSTPLEDMSEAKRSAAWKNLCAQVAKAWRDAERPKIDQSLNGKKVPRKAENLKILASPATRRAEVFIRPDNSDDWYHQGAIPAGRVACTCYFGNEKTKTGTGYHIIAVTTDVPVPNQGGKPTNPLPKSRTRSEQMRVIRA